MLGVNDLNWSLTESLSFPSVHKYLGIYIGTLGIYIGTLGIYIGTLGIYIGTLGILEALRLVDRDVFDALTNLSTHFNRYDFFKCTISNIYIYIYIYVYIICVCVHKRTILWSNFNLTTKLFGTFEYIYIIYIYIYIYVCVIIYLSYSVKVKVLLGYIPN